MPLTDIQRNDRCPDMPSILDKIVAAKREELADAKRAAPLTAVQQAAAELPRPINLSAALSGDGIRLIAEVKKASPSRGLLSPDFDPVRLAGTYVANGAAAVSCLTDPRFQGELAHLSAIKQTGASGRSPVLRKDFIFDPYQVYEARAAGADGILLIVAILEPALLKELLETAQSLGMQCLVEVHDEGELETALGCGRRNRRHQQPRPPHLHHRPCRHPEACPAGSAGQSAGQRERHLHP